LPRALARGKQSKYKTALAETIKQLTVAKAKSKSSLILTLNVVANIINSNPNLTSILKTLNLYFESKCN